MSWTGVIISEASSKNVHSHIRHHENIPYFYTYAIDFNSWPLYYILYKMPHYEKGQLKTKLKLQKKTVKLQRTQEMLRKYRNHWLYFE